MIWLRACPRCETGDVTLGSDFYGWRAVCLQCGYSREFASEREAKLTMLVWKHKSEKVAVTARDGEAA